MCYFIQAITWTLELLAMTQIAIQEQIEAIRQASAEALKSKEKALQLLIDAGIIKDEKKETATFKKK